MVRITVSGLNPLSAGRSFQTADLEEVNVNPDVLIPYQQGGLFRLITSSLMATNIES